MNTDKTRLYRIWIYRLSHFQVFLMVILVAGFPYNEYSQNFNPPIQMWMYALLIFSFAIMLRDVQELIKTKCVKG